MWEGGGQGGLELVEEEGLFTLDVDLTRARDSDLVLLRWCCHEVLQVFGSWLLRYDHDLQLGNVVTAGGLAYVLIYVLGRKVGGIFETPCWESR